MTHIYMDQLGDDTYMGQPGDDAYMYGSVGRRRMGQPGMILIWVSQEMTQIWVSREMTQIWVSREADIDMGQVGG